MSTVLFPTLRRTIATALLLTGSMLLLGCEEQIVEGVTSNTSVGDQRKPGRDAGLGSPMTGKLAGTAWRVTTPARWPDVLITLAFGSSGRYAVTLVENPNVIRWETRTEINTIQLSGDWSLSGGVLTVEAHPESPLLVGPLRRIDSAVLCWDLPGPGEPPCGIILVRIRT